MIPEILTKSEIRIVSLALREGSVEIKKIRITNIPISNISGTLDNLVMLNLICIENKKIIKPNLEKIKATYPWFFIEEIKKIVIEFEFGSKTKFKLGRTNQIFLHLLCKYPDGLSQKSISNGIERTKPIFYNSRKELEECGLIKIEGQRGKKILPNFVVNYNLYDKEKRIINNIPDEKLLRDKPSQKKNNQSIKSVEPLTGEKRETERKKTKEKIWSISEQNKLSDSYKATLTVFLVDPFSLEIKKEEFIRRAVEKGIPKKHIEFYLGGLIFLKLIKEEGNIISLNI